MILIFVGIIKMLLLCFIILIVFVIIFWFIIFIYLGEKLGENWENINDIVGLYVKLFVIGGVVFIFLYFVIKKWIKKCKNFV